MIRVTIGGCNNHHPKNFMVSHVNGSKDYLLLLTKTETCFNIDGEEFNTPPGTFVLFNRNVPRFYGNKYGEYVNDWLHFDFEKEESPFDKLKIPLNKPVTLLDIPSVSLIISLIISELYTKSDYHKEILDNYMHVLIYRVSEQIQNINDSIKSNPMYIKIQDIRSRIYNEPQRTWVIDDICKELNISSSYFYHLYKSSFHVSCLNDVINARIEKAKYYLLQSVMSIKSISELCGYKNEIHFSRQFKRNTGFSPRDYRDKMFKKSLIGTSDWKNTKHSS